MALKILNDMISVIKKIFDGLHELFIKRYLLHFI